MIGTGEPAMHCKSTLLLAVAGSALFALATSASAESFTTRIETRPYYGAIVTLEHGVRVIRPLPPDRQVIINPDRVPLSLSYSDTNVYGYGSSSSGASYAPADGGMGYGGGDDTYYAPAWGRGFRGHRGFNHFNGPRGRMPGAHQGKVNGFQAVH
jgi:hypothetical protein